MLLLIISFVSGVLTVLAPCILPLLPVIVGGTLSSSAVDNEKFNYKKAFTIILSLGVSVILFTLLLKVSTFFIDVPEAFWKWISGGIIILFGLVTIFPSIWENKYLARLNSSSNMLLAKGNRKENFLGNIIIGAALGPVFSTCSPTYFIVLATVLPVNFLLGISYLVTYVIGLGLALLFVSLAGHKIMQKLDLAADPKGWFKRTLGVIFLIVGLAIIAGFDKNTQIFILNSGFFDVTQIEQKLLEKNEAVTTTVVGQQENDVTPSAENSSEKTVTLKNNSPQIQQKVKKQLLYRKVPELSTIDGYINTDGKPITLESLRGKVVLLDIWTYSCINCQRTLPYIKDWYAKYKDQGLVVVGLHTPEFSFEKVQDNVEKAVKKFGITYPVVMDNDYSTWKALGNQYWPRKYLIDIDGYIVYDHIGEGGYDETEKAIQKALAERNHEAPKTSAAAKGSDPANVISVETNKVKSPEIYFGSARNSFLGNGRYGISGEQVFQMPSSIDPNKVYLKGTWNFDPEYAENKNAAEIVFKYEAKNVYMAAGSAEGVEVEIYKDDVLVKKVMIKEETLYTLIEGSDYGSHVLKIIIPKSGLKAFTFTFG